MASNYKLTYNVKTGESKLLYGDSSMPFEPGKYTLYIEGIDKDGTYGYYYNTLYVEEYPYNYSFAFYGPYTFDDVTVDTSMLMVECFDSMHVSACSDSSWYYNINGYNANEQVDPGERKILSNLKGKYNIYFEGIDTYWNNYSYEIKEAFSVNDVYEEIKDCEWVTQQGPCIDWTSAYRDNDGALDMETFCVEYDEYDVCL